MWKVSIIMNFPKDIGVTQKYITVGGGWVCTIFVTNCYGKYGWYRCKLLVISAKIYVTVFQFIPTPNALDFETNLRF